MYPVLYVSDHYRDQFYIKKILSLVAPPVFNTVFDLLHSTELASPSILTRSPLTTPLIVSLRLSREDRSLLLDGCSLA